MREDVSEELFYRTDGDVIELDTRLISKIAKILAKPGEAVARTWAEATRFDAQNLNTPVVPKYSSPVRDFEKRLGVKGISKQWEMPRGRSYEETQKIMFPHIHAVVASQGAEGSLMSSFVVTAFFDELMRLNQDFKVSPVIAQSLVLRAHAAYGAISQFNLSDITHYCLNPDAEPSADPMGCSVRFVMSPETQQKVDAYFENEFLSGSRTRGSRRGNPLVFSAG